MSENVERAVEAVVRDLVRAKRVQGVMYVNLPLFYPDGSHVTVRIDQAPSGLRVSDAGFAYREIEDIASPRAFRRTANKVAEATGVTVGERSIYAECDVGELERAIADVAETSWRIVSTVFERVFDEEETRLSDELTARLKATFGEANVDAGAKIIGTSTTEWTVSALVKVGDDPPAVFQAVTDNHNSINRASTAFRDLSTLDRAPKLIAFVRNKAELGPRLGLLVPGKVVEEAQPNDVFRKAAA